MHYYNYCLLTNKWVLVIFVWQFTLLFPLPSIIVFTQSGHALESCYYLRYDATTNELSLCGLIPYTLSFLI